MTAAAGAALRSPAARRLGASLTAALLLVSLPAFPATQAVHLSAVTTASAGWLDRFNLWRAEAGQSVLTENATWSAGDYNHAVYMVKNNLVTHYETAGVPYYTTAGDTAAQNSNIFVSSSTATTDEQAIDWWMGAPFHAMAMMDPRLTQTGFGSYRDGTTSPWQLGAALNVSSGNSYTGGQFPVYFPGNLSTEPLTAYSGNEFPDPTSACPGYAGLPVFIELGGNVSTTATVHTITGNGALLDTCAIDSTNASLSSYLKARGGVIVMPKLPLQAGVKYVVALTVNGVPYTWSFSVGALVLPPPLPGWTSLGGGITGSPAVSSWGASRMDAFVRGNDDALWQKTWNGTSWGPWTSLGGVLTAEPTAVSWGPNRIDIFVRGSGNALWHRSSDGTTWGAWESLGGIMTSGPSATSSGLNHLDVFVAGTDNHGVWRSSWNGTSWSWTSLGGVISADPSAIASSPTRTDVFVVGSGNGLWQGTLNGSSFTWTPLGGVVMLSPATSSCATGHFDVFVVGTNGGIWQRGFNGTSLGAWTSLGGNFSSGPGAVCPPGTAAVNLFARYLDGALWTGTVAGS
ncbi:MAG: CAP domain-containing protein [Candidatus Dormibacterales bacterium]